MININLYRETSSRHPFISAPLKHGFQWLSKQTSADAVVVDEKTSASVLEHLVFKYDLLSENLSLVCMCMFI